MLDIYLAVTSTDLPHFMVARITLPSNLHFKAWEEVTQMAEDARVVHFLRFGFFAGHEVLVPTPANGNHSSAVNYAGDLDIYVAMEIRE